MTAATPPACCADADHGKPLIPLDRIGRVDRGDVAFAGADAVVAGVGAGVLRGRRVSDADADTDTDADTTADAYTDADTDAYRHAVADSITVAAAERITLADSDAGADRHRRG
jgi:hypothetical protein